MSVISPQLSSLLRFLYLVVISSPLFFFFFFNDTATTEIYTLSLHDALPIFLPVGRSDRCPADSGGRSGAGAWREHFPPRRRRDRKSTRLNSSHGYISYAVFCLKKKKTTPTPNTPTATTTYRPTALQPRNRST